MLWTIIALQFLFACSTPLNKLLLGQTTPLFLMTLRLLCAGGLLLFGTLLFDRPNIAYTKRHGMLFGKKILFGSYLKYLLKYWGLLYMPAIKMSLLLYCTPFCAALISYVTVGERLSLRQMIGLCTGFLGMIPLLFVQTGSTFFTPPPFFLLPECAVIGAVMAHSYGIYCTQQLIRTHEYSASLVSALGAIGGGLLSLVTALCVHDPLHVADAHQFFPLFCMLVFVCNIVCNTWYIRLLKKHSTTFLSLTDYLNPLFVAFYSWLLLGETITWHYVCAAAIIFIGLYIFNSKSSNQ